MKSKKQKITSDDIYENYDELNEKLNLIHQKLKEIKKIKDQIFCE